jgi:hypothetical protein
MKSIFFLLAVIGSIEGIAQSNLTDQLLADFSRSKALTLIYIESMPDSVINKRPGTGSRTFSEQVLHLSQGLINLSSNGTGSERPYAQVNLEKDSTLHNKADLIRLSNESHDLVIAALQKM